MTPTLFIKDGLIQWVNGSPETRCVETPLLGRPEEGCVPLYDQAALDEATAELRQELADMKAHCEQLRDALMYCRGYVESHAEHCQSINGLIGDIDEFLTETPAQSLANLRAKVLREAAEFVGRNLYDCKTYEDELLRMADKEEQR